MSFRVRLTRDAEADLERLFDFVFGPEREREGGDLDLAEPALVAIRAGFAALRTSPFTCRKAGQSPFFRELIIPFGASGNVALFEIFGSTDVVVSALRHHLKDDYH